MAQSEDLQVQLFFMQKEQEEQVLEEKPLGENPPGGFVSTLLKVSCDGYNDEGSTIRLLFESV